jgi:PAS domain S-box-containing protein
MTTRLRPLLLRYGVALLSVALAALARLLLGPAWGPRYPLMTFFAAVLFTAWVAGLGPALLALGLGLLTATYLFTPSPGELAFYELGPHVRLVAYVVFGAGSALLVGSLKSARGRAEASLRQALHRQGLLEQEIAERQRLEAALRESEGRHRVISELTSDFTFTACVGPDGAVELVSATEGLAAITGYDLKELNARGGWATVVHPEDLPLVERALQRLLAGEPAASEARCLTRTGQVRWLRYLAHPVWDAALGRVVRLYGAVQDVTTAKQAQDAVEASERRFRSLVEKGWDAFGLVDAEGGIDYGSPTTARLLGFAPEELVGRNGFELVHPEDVEQAWCLFGRLLQAPGGSNTAAYRFRHKDGSWRWLEVTGTNLLADPAVQAVVVNYRDVTERRRLEEELRRHAEELQEADRRKDEFLAMLAHELRNPLAPIRNALHLLKHPGTGGPVAEELRAMMERQVGHLARLVDDLLDVSRITQGKITLRKEVVELAPLVRRTAEALRPTVDDRRHALAVSVPAEPVCLEADPTRLEQVLTNLVQNAAKYTHPGGHIWLAARREGKEVVLSVRDSGVGMTPEVLRHVFDLFVQGERGLDRSPGGLGIGLTLVRRLVELHGGSVRASSAGPGRGSEFVVRLPALGEAPAGAAAGGPSGGRPAAARRILVVDDNRDVADSHALVLRLAGHSVRAVYDGATALAEARAYRPDLVFLDIGMPGMDGYEVARRLRQQQGLEKVTLVALTGWGQDEDRRRSKEAGIDHHLVKPVDPDAVKELLAHLHPAAQAPPCPG